MNVHGECQLSNDMQQKNGGTMKRLFFLSLALLSAFCGFSSAVAGTAYDFELVGDGAVIAREGTNTGFASVIHVPDWIPVHNFHLR